jgi:hypothetical protein
MRCAFLLFYWRIVADILFISSTLLFSVKLMFPQFLSGEMRCQSLNNYAFSSKHNATIRNLMTSVKNCLNPASFPHGHTGNPANLEVCPMIYIYSQDLYESVIHRMHIASSYKRRPSECGCFTSQVSH